MFMSRHPAFGAKGFIGGGLAMVAYGYSAALGIVEPCDEAGEASPHAAEDASPGAGSERGLAECLGNRLEVHLYRGC